MGSTYALRADGTVSAWGLNTSRQLGDGTTTTRTTPVTVVGATNVVQITSGSLFACALRANGTVLCWGANGSGQLGAGSTSTTGGPSEVVGLTDAVEIASGHAHTCARRATGNVVCWGWNNVGQIGDATTTVRTAPVMVPTISDSVGLALGFAHTCVLRASGEVTCWGQNTYGQLGDGTTRARNTQAPVLGLTDAVEIVSTMDYFSSYTSLPYADRVCARRRSGTVVCWGYNGNGQVGDSTTTNRLTPTAVVGLSDVTELAPAGRRHTCARRVDGTVACWGYGVSGQLGNGMSVPRTAPVTVTGVP